MLNRKAVTILYRVSIPNLMTLGTGNIRIASWLARSMMPIAINAASSFSQAPLAVRGVCQFRVIGRQISRLINTVERTQATVRAMAAIPTSLNRGAKKIRMNMRTMLILTRPNVAA